MEEKYLSLNELNRSYIFFQKSIFPVNEIAERLLRQNEQLEQNGMLEVLPSVYMKLTQQLKTRQKVKMKVLKLLGMKKSAQMNSENYLLLIDNRNIRDYFHFHTYVANHQSDSTYESTLIEKGVIHYLPHTKWGYPTTLGGGSRDCPIWGHFNNQGIFTTFGEQYKLLSVADLLEVTKYKPEYIERFCMKSTTCSMILPKLKNNEYVPGVVIGKDDIEADLQGERYSFGEGKHRRCAAKRAETKQVPVKVSVYAVTGREDSFAWTNQQTQMKLSYKCSRLMLEECYEQYSNLGLTKEQVRYLNENINNEQYIEYLEKTTGQKFENLRNDFKGLSQLKI